VNTGVGAAGRVLPIETHRPGAPPPAGRVSEVLALTQRPRIGSPFFRAGGDDGAAEQIWPWQDLSRPGLSGVGGRSSATTRRSRVWPGEAAVVTTDVRRW